MDKKAVARIKYSLLLSAVIITIFLVYFALANHDVLTSGGATIYNVNEDVVFGYNISVNNTNFGEPANITQVNITIPASFTVIGSYAGTSAGAVLTNTSTVLSWSNTTGGYVVNGSNTTRYFWFNATATNPGSYNITVTTSNITGSYSSNITVIVNDTTAPVVGFISPIAGSSYSGSLAINASINETVLVSTVFFNITNTSDQVSKVSAIQQGSSIYWNGTLDTTALAEGLYNATIYANDSANNLNSSIKVQFLVDNTAPAYSYGANATATGNYSQTWIFANVSASDAGAGVGTMTVYLYNALGMLLNTSLSAAGSSNVTINWTGLSNGLYYVNATLNDTAGNINSSLATKIIRLDTTGPVIGYDALSTTTGAYSQNWVYVNLNVTDALTAVSSINLTLYDSAWAVNVSIFAQLSNNITSNFTGLSDGTYYINVTANDSLGNIARNKQTIILDRVAPMVVYGNTATATGNYSQTWIFANVSANDSSAGVGTLRVYLYNASGFLNTSLSAAGSSNVTINWTGLSNGLYYVNATLNDTAGNINSSLATKIIRLDTTGPVIGYGDAATATGNYSQTWIYINMTLSDGGVGINSINTTLYNATWASFSSTFAVSSSNISLNATSLNDGTYYLNSTANDTVGNIARAMRIIRLDTVNPVINSSLTTSTNASAAVITFITNESVNASISYGADAGLGTNTGTNEFNLSFSFTLSSLTASTTYYYNITMCDYAQNCITNGTHSFVTAAAATVASNPSGGSAADIPFWTSTVYEDNKELSATGVVSKALSERAKVVVKVKGAQHSVGVVKLTSNSATINISSTPQQATLLVGETKKFDIDNDTYYDLKVTLNSIADNKANVLIESINEKIVQNTAVASGNENAANNNNQQNSGTNAGQNTLAETGESTQSNGSNTWIWVVLVILVLLIILLAVRRKKVSHLKRVGYR